MKRRNFLKLSSHSLLAGTALIGLPKFIWAQQENSDALVTYSNQWNIFFESAICSVVIDNNMFASEKLYLLQSGKNLPITLIDKEDSRTFVSKAFTISKIEKTIIEQNVIYDIYGKYLSDLTPSETSSAFESFDDLAKLQYTQDTSILLYNSRNELVSTLKVNNDTNNQGGFDIPPTDCFVTTACVKHMKLEDDCKELKTLRSLRDNFMKGTSFGEERILAYNHYGPRIVEKLNLLQNVDEVYDYIFKQSVIPTFNLTIAGKNVEAVNLYVDFMIGLWLKLETDSK